MRQPDFYVGLASGVAITLLVCLPIIGHYRAYVATDATEEPEIKIEGNRVIPNENERRDLLGTINYLQRELKETDEALEKCAAARMSECVEVGE